MNFVISVIHGAADPVRAAGFLCKALGFQQKQATSDVIIVENGAISIRLIAEIEPQLSGNSLNLELQTQNLAEASEELMAYAGVTLLSKAVEISKERAESRLQGPHGIKITLVQEFNEDQLGIMPPLPTSLIWDEDAEGCVKKMLRLVPIGFRQPARTRITERAEMLAAEAGSVTVTIDRAVRALAEMTPVFQHPALVSALLNQGIDPGQYFHREAS